MLRLTKTWWCCQLALDGVLNELVYVSARNFSGVKVMRVRQSDLLIFVLF